MGREKVLFQSEEPKDIQSVSQFLHQLANKLAEKQVVLRQGAEELIITVPNNVVLELKVEEEDKKGKLQRSLEVEIEWTEGDNTDAGVTLG